MKGLMTTVTNITNGKRYFVSTVKCSRSEDVNPADWDGEEMFISALGDEVYAAFDAMIARLRGTPTATE
jgi:hypothetical protein